MSDRRDFLKNSGLLASTVVLAPSALLTSCNEGAKEGVKEQVKKVMTLTEVRTAHILSLIHI